MSRRVFVDINVLLDVLARRTPHYAASAAVWAAAEMRAIQGVVSAHSVTTLYYLLRRASDHATALRGIRLLREIFGLVAVNAEVIDAALASPLPDFEDAVQYQCALSAGATVIVTRDVRHFRDSTIAVLTPEAFVAQPGEP